MAIKLKRLKHPILFPDIPTSAAEAIVTEQTYDPLPSVWSGDDAELLEKMLDFYPRSRPKKILDAAVNGGRFWTGSRRPVIGMDIDSKHKPDIVGDKPARRAIQRIFPAAGFVVTNRDAARRGTAVGRGISARTGLSPRIIDASQSIKRISASAGIYGTI